MDCMPFIQCAVRWQRSRWTRGQPSLRIVSKRVQSLLYEILKAVLPQSIIFVFSIKMLVLGVKDNTGYFRSLSPLGVLLKPSSTPSFVPHATFLPNAERQPQVPSRYTRQSDVVVYLVPFIQHLGTRARSWTSIEQVLNKKLIHLEVENGKGDGNHILWRIRHRLPIGPPGCWLQG